MFHFSSPGSVPCGGCLHFFVSDLLLFSFTLLLFFLGPVVRLSVCVSASATTFQGAVFLRVLVSVIVHAVVGYFVFVPVLVVFVACDMHKIYAFSLYFSFVNSISISIVVFLALSQSIIALSLCNLSYSPSDANHFSLHFHVSFYILLCYSFHFLAVNYFDCFGICLLLESGSIIVLFSKFVAYLFL